jgi:ribosomal protein L28
VIDIIGHRPRIGDPQSASFRPGRTCIAFEINGRHGHGQVYAEGHRVSRSQIWQPNWALYRVWVEVDGRQTPLAVVSPPEDRAPSLCPEFYPEHLR